MHRPFVIATSIFVLVGTSMAQTGLDTVVLYPSMIDPSLAFLDTEQPLGDKVKFSVTGLEKYDTFFLDVARVHGTVAIADTLTAQFGRALKTAAVGVSEVDLADPSKWPEAIEKVAGNTAGDPGAVVLVDNASTRLLAIMPALSSVEQQVAQLLSSGGDLITSAPSDFDGWSKRLKLIGVIRGLNTSIRALHATGESAVATIGRVRPILDATGRLSDRQPSTASTVEADSTSPALLADAYKDWEQHISKLLGPDWNLDLPRTEFETDDEYAARMTQHCTKRFARAREAAHGLSERHYSQIPVTLNPYDVHSGEFVVVVLPSGNQPAAPEGQRIRTAGPFRRVPNSPFVSSASFDTIAVKCAVDRENAKAWRQAATDGKLTVDFTLAWAEPDSSLNCVIQPHGSIAALVLKAEDRVLWRWGTPGEAENTSSRKH